MSTTNTKVMVTDTNLAFAKEFLVKELRELGKDDNMEIYREYCQGENVLHVHPEEFADEREYLLYCQHTLEDYLDSLNFENLKQFMIHHKFDVEINKTDVSLHSEPILVEKCPLIPKSSTCVIC